MASHIVGQKIFCFTTTPNRMTRWNIIGGVLLFSLLLFVIIQLGRSNYTSCVQIKANVKKIAFRLKTDATLFEGWQFTEIQLGNASLSFNAENLSIAGSIRKKYGAEPIELQPKWSDGQNWITTTSRYQLYYGGIALKANSTVKLEIEKNRILISVTSPYAFDSTLSNFSANEVLTIQSHGSHLVGSNVSMDDEDSALFKLDGFKDIYVVHPREFFVQLGFDSSSIQKSDFANQQFDIDSIRFDEPDPIRPDGPFRTSFISKASVQIGNNDIFRKPFLISEYKIEDGEFMMLENRNTYNLKIGGIEKNLFLIDLFSDAATDVRVGERFKFLRSAFPSILEFIIAEPGKKVIWSIVVFLVGGYFAFREKFPKKRIIESATTNTERYVVLSTQRPRRRHKSHNSN